MKQGIEKNELFQASHLVILIRYTIFSVVLITEALILGWEKWALMLISIALVFSWIIHFRQHNSDGVRLWIYSCLMMCTFFFYGIHQTSTFDLATVMITVILLYTMTGIKSLICLCQITYLVTMAYDITSLALSGEVFDILTVTRLLLHVAMIIMSGRISMTIIDKWHSVLERSRSEIEELKDATDRLNDFLANVSHEIRTPINAVIGLSGICADKEKDSAVRADMLSVNAAGRRVAEQISDILDYSEIDRGMLAKNVEDYMLSSVLNDLVNEIRPYKSDDIELVIDIDPAIPSVMKTDIGKLKKILRHLIVNGLKYTREGGVYVRITSIKKDYGVNLLIEVTDTGIGMTDEERDRVTERFYQADSGRTRSSSGLGLGMPIVSGFVASLGGFMRVDSTPGKGTSVHVSIPQQVVDESACMSINDREKLCLGAFLHFEKFSRPEVRDYYNIMVMNIVRGLGVQMHRVDNAVNLSKLLDTVRLTHLFVGEEEYKEDPALMEKLAKSITVIVSVGSSFRLPENSDVRIMVKPFYCFPVAAILNEDTDNFDQTVGKMYCEGIKALVVDDEPMNLTVAKSIFTRYGMKVSTAASGNEAIEMCRSERYDIVFMDHMMPGMDGVEAMKRIRTDPGRARSDLPIVALTANAVSTAKEMFIAEGFDGFVSKPIELIELERTLKKVLPAAAITYDRPKEPSVTGAAVAGAAVAEPATREAAVAADNAADPYKMLETVGVDTNAGIGYCMQDEEFYKSLLRQFASEAEKKQSSLDKCFTESDIKTYGILAHGLKSTSKMIGCANLSEKARELEFAAKEGRTGYINEHHAGVMEQYRQLTGVIRAAYGDMETGSDTADEVQDFKPESEDDVMEFAPAESED